MVEVSKTGSFTRSSNPRTSLKSINTPAPSVDLKHALDEQNKSGERISELGEDLQQERVQKSLDKVEAFHVLKKEVGIAVCKLRLQADEVKFKIRAALYRNEGDDGLLTHEEDSYFKCVDVDQTKLDQLFSKDEDHWRVNLREARDTLATYKSNL